MNTQLLIDALSWVERAAADHPDCPGAADTARRLRDAIGPREGYEIQADIEADKDGDYAARIYRDGEFVNVVIRRSRDEAIAAARSLAAFEGNRSYIYEVIAV